MFEKVRLLKEVFGSFRPSGEEVLFHCPKCKHHKKKLSINVSKGVFKCWICDWAGKDIGSIIRSYGTRKHVYRWHELNEDLDLYEDEIEVQEAPLELPSEWQNILEDSTAAVNARKYLAARGVTRADCIKWKLGVCSIGSFRDRIIFTSFDRDGQLNFFTGRTFKNETLKYKNCQSSRDIVYNELMVDWDEDLTLVEGPLDAIKAGNAIPLLGSTLRENSRLFQEVCNRKREVYLALDADAKKKETAIASRFLDYGLKVYKIDPGSHRDVGDLSKNQFQNRKQMAKQITNDYLFYNDIFNMELI